jgi:transcriptional regulator NrdR family protein
MRCPICEIDIIVAPSKTWNYAGYNVARYLCSNCHEKFNTYSVDGSLKFTVPKE